MPVAVFTELAWIYKVEIHQTAGAGLAEKPTGQGGCKKFREKSYDIEVRHGWQLAVKSDVCPLFLRIKSDFKRLAFAF